MGFSSQPEPPDPFKMAQAQAQQNQSTAMMQQLMNQYRQTDAYGNVVDFNKAGVYSYKDPVSGKTKTVDKYSRDVTLSPEQQVLLNKQTQGQNMFADTALNLFGQAKENLSTPFHYAPGEHEAWAGGIYNDLNRETIRQNEEGLRTRLANQGQYGEGAGNDLQAMYEGNQNARNRFMLDSYGQGLQQALTERQLPLNEALAMFGKAGIQTPEFGATPQVALPTPDIAGMMMNNYNIQAQNAASDTGALGGILGSALGGWASKGFALPAFLSDRRAKKNIQRVGKMDDGTNIYKYEYKKPFGGGLTHLGVMAQEVKKTHPEAVSERPDGLLQVDYGQLGGEAA